MDSVGNGCEHSTKLNIFSLLHNVWGLTVEDTDVCGLESSGCFLTYISGNRLMDWAGMNEGLAQLGWLTGLSTCVLSMLLGLLYSVAASV